MDDDNRLHNYAAGRYGGPAPDGNANDEQKAAFASGQIDRQNAEDEKNRQEQAEAARIRRIQIAKERTIGNDYLSQMSSDQKGDLGYQVYKKDQANRKDKMTTHKDMLWLAGFAAIVIILNLVKLNSMSLLIFAIIDVVISAVITFYHYRHSRKANLNYLIYFSISFIITGFVIYMIVYGSNYLVNELRLII